MVERAEIMDDCFWCFINGVCDCTHCNDCEEYISVNSDKGRKLYGMYESDVNKVLAEALIPLSRKWKKIKEQRE